MKVIAQKALFSRPVSLPDRAGDSLPVREGDKVGDSQTKADPVRVDSSILV